jgi:hypothetical protein
MLYESSSMQDGESSMIAKQQLRMRNFKKGLDHDDSRRRRAEVTVQIRKNKRDDRYNRRRRTESSVVAVEQTGMAKSADSLRRVFVSPELMMEYAQGLFSSDPNAQLSSAQQFRRLLSVERLPPIQQVIDAGVVPKLTEFLSRHECPRLQFEAAWALTNIASGTTDHTRVVVEADAVPIFVRLLRSGSEDVREQAAWALGNIAGDSTQCRDLVLSHGALPALIGCFTEHSRLSTIRNGAWSLSNLCRGKPAPDLSTLEVVLPLLSRLLMSNDMETVVDACWALSYISDGSNDRIQAVIDTGVCPRLVQLLGPAASPAVLRTIGNIVTGDDMQTQVIIDLNVLPTLLWLLDHPKKIIRKETCWMISNITAGTSEQIQSVIEANIFPHLIQLLQTEEFDIQREIAWAVSNATAGGTAAQIRYIVQQGAVKPLCDMLSAYDSKIVKVALEALENILKLGHAQAVLSGEPNEMVTVIADADGIAKIDDLQNHDQDEVYQKAVQILEIYFGAETAEESSVAPVVDTTGMYSFGASLNYSASGFQF